MHFQTLQEGSSILRLTYYIQGITDTLVISGNALKPKGNIINNIGLLYKFNKNLKH